MFSILIQALILASSGLLSVGSITLVILLLLSDRGWRNGLGYALGYISAYSIIGIAAVILGYRASQNTAAGPGSFFPIILLFFGTLLLWLSFRNWRKPEAEEKTEPRFFSIVDRITPFKAFGFGAMVSVINFKNLTLFLTALSVVILSNLILTQKIIITLLVVLVFCLSVIIPIVIFLSFPNRAKEVLSAIKQFLNQHSRQIGIWAPLIFGLLFLIKGLTDLL